ncbi:beta,beta-carotene 15,15'-dioxygenase-like [Haliotis rufescens]|uniref:beta,beta-carotene 15,15'-dioxygenase-like n=1 Tax=Haliotis rufescens TaxID=6454 RepID=UPI001EAFCCE4|nr:beta,beta-carotene 15,15'-dioxygenase-like [Haliotis rufescens]
MSTDGPDELPGWLNYTPEDQLEKPVDTDVTGTIPQWVTGTLYRNGSGMFKVGETTVKHLFDGMAVLHKFIIKDGKVQYQNKLLDSDTLTRSLKANRLVVGQFSTAAYPDPCKSIFARFFSYFTPEMTDNTAVNIVPHGDMLLALTETPSVNIVDPETLTKKGSIPVDKLVAVHVATAHPHTDSDGTMYNLGTSFNHKQAYNIIKVPPKEKGGDNPFNRASLVSTFPSRWKVNIGYNHSFGMSENYFVVLEQTLVTNILKLPLMSFAGTGFESCMYNYPDEKVLIHLARRSDGKTLTTQYTADAFFCFHFINCYEEDSNLVIDFCAFDDGGVVHDLYLSDVKKGVLGKHYAKLRRCVLPLDVEKAETGKNLVTLPDTSATAVKQPDGSIFCTPDYITGDASNGVMMELPRINYAFNTKKYRYSYGTRFLTDKPMLTKVDMKTRTCVHWTTEDGDQPGEPVFIARPGGTEEDDGIILSPVLPMKPGRKGFLLVLDGKTFKELARAETPPGVKMPLSFHGSFIP